MFKQKKKKKKKILHENTLLCLNTESPGQDPGEELRGLQPPPPPPKIVS